MNVQEIISQIDQEIAALTKVREALMGMSPENSILQPSAAIAKTAIKKTEKRKMSAEGKARIAAAQKARWAKVKRQK